MGGHRFPRPSSAWDSGRTRIQGPPIGLPRHEGFSHERAFASRCRTRRYRRRLLHRALRTGYGCTAIRVRSFSDTYGKRAVRGLPAIRRADWSENRRAMGGVLHPGAIAFETTGVVAGLVTPLAEIGCPVFVVSTFDGDILMVPTTRRAHALNALQAAGHVIADR